jgi:hypothetical protein
VDIPPPNWRPFYSRGPQADPPSSPLPAAPSTTARTRVLSPQLAVTGRSSMTIAKAAFSIAAAAAAV